MTGAVTQPDYFRTLRPRFRGRARSVLAELRETTRFFISSCAVEDIFEHRQRTRRRWPKAAVNMVTTFVGPRTEPCAAGKLPGMLPGTPWLVLMTFPAILLDIRKAFTRLRVESYHTMLDAQDELRTIAEKYGVAVWQDLHEAFHAAPDRELVAA